MAKGRPAVAFIADLTKHGLSAVVIDEPEIDLRVPPAVLDQLDELEKSHAERLPYVETTLAPRVMHLVDDIVTMQLAASNYARFVAATEIFGRLSENEQRQEFAQYSIGTPPWFAHTIGVNCSLQTADDKLVWTLRPDSAVVEPSVFAPVMNEGSNTADLINGNWNPDTVARRGFHEELGFSLSRPELLHIDYHSAVAQFGNGGISILGHATTTLTFDEVLEQSVNAPDAREHANGLFACHADAETFLAFMEAHPIDTWSTWGVAAVWHLATNHLNVTVPHLELQPLEVQTVSA